MTLCALAECDTAATMYAQGQTITQVSRALHHGEGLTRKLIIAGGGTIRSPHAHPRVRRNRHFHCDKCEILLAESGDGGHENDKPGDVRCWACRKDYGEP